MPKRTRRSSRRRRRPSRPLNEEHLPTTSEQNGAVQVPAAGVVCFGYLLGLLSGNPTGKETGDFETNPDDKKKWPPFLSDVVSSGLLS